MKILVCLSSVGACRHVGWIFKVEAEWVVHHHVRQKALCIPLRSSFHGTLGLLFTEGVCLQLLLFGICFATYSCWEINVYMLSQTLILQDCV